MLSRKRKKTLIILPVLVAGLAYHFLADGLGWMGTGHRQPPPVNLPPSPYDASLWMTQAYRDSPRTALRDICIPGTHDSGSYAICGIGENVAQTTEWTLGEQLKEGYRYLDLRLAWRENAFHLVHGICTSALAEEGFQDIEDFARSHPREIVIIKLVPIGLDKIQRRRLTQELVLSHLGNRMLEPKGIRVTFQDFWEKDKNILLAWCGDDFHQYSSLYWHKEVLIVEHWSNTDEVPFLIKDQLRFLAKLEGQDRLHVAQLVLTPSTRCFFLYGLSIQDITYRELDHSSFILRLSEKARKHGLAPNIMMVDFPEHQESFRACMEVNRLLAGS